MEIFYSVVYLAVIVSFLFLISPLLITIWFLWREKNRMRLKSAYIIIIISFLSWLIVVMFGWEKIFMSARRLELASIVFFISFFLTLLIRYIFTKLKDK